MRRTQTVIAIARVLMSDPDKPHWGASIIATTNVTSGSVYPILRRMENEGWLDSILEVTDAGVTRPPRRYVRVTATGRVALAALAATPMSMAGPPWGSSAPLTAEDVMLLTGLAFKWDVTPQQALRRALREALEKDGDS